MNTSSSPSHCSLYHGSFCRFLCLFFRAYPSEATRSGYRHLIPEDDTLLRELSTGGESLLSSDIFLLHALQGCSYDHKLMLSSSYEIDQYCQRVERLLQEALNIDTTLLDPEQNVDHALIVSQLRLELVKWREVRVYEKDPAFYLHFEAIHILLPVWGDDTCKDESQSSSTFLLQDLSHPGVASLGVTYRLLALLSRLRAFPQMLMDARINLTAPVHIFVERAISLCLSFGKFLKEDFPHLVKKLASYLDSQESTFTECLMKELALAAQVAVVCILQYREFLEDQLLSKAVHPAAVGKEVYEKLLFYGHFLPSSDDLLSVGEQHFAEVKQQLQDVARGINPTRSWQEITEQVIWPLHPSAATLLPSYMEEIKRARNFVVSQDVLPPLPEGERVIGFHTPSFLVPFSPFGDFLDPAPFADAKNDPHSRSCKRTGYLMLHSVEAMSLPPEEEEKLLQAHDFTWISVIAPHECYPGHHVQALLAQQHPRVLRKFYKSTLFYEGWGLYCENLAFELGFFRQPGNVCSHMGQMKMSPEEFEQLSRLTQLRLQLWRSVRIILDVKFHRGELSFAQCQEFLQDEVMFNPQSTAGEVFMYASSPTYAPCYVAGYLNLMQLREETRRKLTEEGRAFNLNNFHQCLLSKGCLPFQLLKTLV